MGRPAELEHENKERILRTGWELFQKKGYRGVTMDDLCQQCRLTKPTLYYYFKDKEDVFVQVLRAKLESFHASIDQAGTLAERLEAVARAMLENFETEYTLFIRDCEHLKDPANLAAIRSAFRSELFHPLAALMQNGIARGELRGENGQTLTLLFLGVINNFIGKEAEMGVSPSELAARLVDFFLHGAQK